ncbi:MAG: GNAT family N-acetyltransferase [Opitutales bacterium]
MGFELEVNAQTHLRLLGPEDAPSLARTIDRDREHLRAWLPWVDDSRGADTPRRHIELWAHGFARGSGFSVGIFHEMLLAGVIGFHGFDVLNRVTSIGYWLGKPFTGRGLMTGSVAALLDYAVFDRRMNRIFIRCATGNRPSRAIPERLGFVHEGTQREAEWLYDHFVDLELYSILAREWHDLRSRWRGEERSDTTAKRQNHL